MPFEILVLILVVSALAVGIPILMFGRRERPETEPSVHASRPEKAWGKAHAHSQIVPVLDRWYASHPCVACQRAIAQVPKHGGPGPGLLDPANGRVVCWEDLDSDDIVDVLATHQALCASCFTAEWFRQQYPDRVVDRAPTPFRDNAVY